MEAKNYCKKIDQKCRINSSSGGDGGGGTSHTKWWCVLESLKGLEEDEVKMTAVVCVFTEL